MFIFHRVKLGKSSQRQCGKKKVNNSEEIDIIIVHREICIILVKTKSMDNFSNRMYGKAKDQLNYAEKVLELSQYARIKSTII